MVGRMVIRWGVLAAGWLAVGTAAADSINFTGNVPSDFGYTNPTTIPPTNSLFIPVASTNPNVDVIQYKSDMNSTHIAQPQWMTDSGLVSGWNFRNLAVAYNPQNDTLYVGVNTWGIAGNVDGNGTPGSPDPRLTQAHGSDPANFGGDKALAIGITPLKGTQPTIVAGVPGDKSQVGSGLDGFTVASYAGASNPGGPNYDLVTSFGKPLSAAAGSSLAFDPSAQHPGFEFTIANFSKVLGYNPLNGFSISAQDGSVKSVVTGKDYLSTTPVIFPEPQSLPEPTTWLAWLLMAGGAGWRYRHRLSARP